MDVAVNCGQEAAKTGVGRFVEVSTAQVYDCDKVLAGRRKGGEGWLEEC